MRTIKLVLLIVICVAMMLIMAANWTDVDLHLLPAALGTERFTYPAVPLALIIVIALLIGFVLAQLLEALRGSGQRRRLEEKRREIGRLRQENAKLTAKLGTDAEDIALGLT